MEGMQERGFRGDPAVRRQFEPSSWYRIRPSRLDDAGTWSGRHHSAPSTQGRPGSVRNPEPREIASVNRSPIGNRQSAIGNQMDPADLLVVGGGITGAGIAQDAAARGLKTILVE